jgi:hypothetical protein
MKRLRTEAAVNALFNAATAVAALAAWQQLGLLDALAQGPKALEELPGELRALEISAPVLAHIGVLVGDGRRYALSEDVARLLAEGALPSGRDLGFIKDLSRLAEVLERGGPVWGDDGAPKETTGGVRPEDSEDTWAGMQAHAASAAPAATAPGSSSAASPNSWAR